MSNTNCFTFLKPWYLQILTINMTAMLTVNIGDYQKRIRVKDRKLPKPRGWGLQLSQQQGRTTVSPAGSTACLPVQQTGFDPWVGKVPWRRKWHPTPVFLPGKSHGQRSLRSRGGRDLHFLTQSVRETKNQVFVVLVYWCRWQGAEFRSPGGNKKDLIFQVQW